MFGMHPGAKLSSLEKFLDLRIRRVDPDHRGLELSTDLDRSGLFEKRPERARDLGFEKINIGSGHADIYPPWLA